MLDDLLGNLTGIPTDAEGIQVDRAVEPGRLGRHRDLVASATNADSGRGTAAELVIVRVGRTIAGIGDADEAGAVGVELTGRHVGLDQEIGAVGRDADLLLGPEAEVAAGGGVEALGVGEGVVTPCQECRGPRGWRPAGRRCP